MASNRYQFKYSILVFSCCAAFADPEMASTVKFRHVNSGRFLYVDDDSKFRRTVGKVEQSRWIDEMAPSSGTGSDGLVLLPLGAAADVACVGGVTV
jgi:hypothetical protein